MREYLEVLAVASLPVFGNMAGGLLAEAVTVSRKVLSITLHEAAGIILAVVGMELMPEAVAADPPWVAVLSFVAGGGAYLLIDQIADLSEGFATVAVFRSRGFSRRRMLFPLLFAVPVLLGATVGFWLVRGQAEIWKLALLAFSAGLLVTVTVEEIVPQAHEGDEARLATVAFISRFALFTLLSVYFE